MASFSRLLLAKIVGAEAEACFCGGPLGGQSVAGLVIVEMGVLERWRLFRFDEPELELEGPDCAVKLVVFRGTTLDVGLLTSVILPPPLIDPLTALLLEELAALLLEAVKVRVKYCSSSIAQTDTIIFASMWSFACPGG